MPILNQGSKFFMRVNPMIPLVGAFRKTPAAEKDKWRGGKKRQEESGKAQAQADEANSKKDVTCQFAHS